jgi:ferritin-like metal-binding protein YciE
MPRNSNSKNTKSKTQSKSRSSASRSNGRSSGNGSSNGNGKQQQGSLLEKFFTNQLKDMYYAEKKGLEGLKKMAQSTTTEELEDAFNEHYNQTERQIRRLEKVFQIIGQKPEGKKCEAMEGLIKEAEEILKDTKENTMTRDAALIIGAQKIEHYEIATYGSLVQLALTMGLNRAADILDKTLVEEEQTDMLLTEIAEDYINLEAEDEGPYSWQKGREENEEEGEGEEEEMEAMGPSAYSM